MERPCKASQQAPRIVFRGKELNARQRARIQEVIKEGKGLARQELAREVCRVFHWRRDNGTWAIRSVSTLLARLEKAGVIRLPAPRHVPARRSREAVVAAAALLSPANVPAAANPLRLEGLGTRLVVRPIGPKESLVFRAHIERYHYLGDAALVGESLRYVAELDGELLALLSWGSASLRNEARDRYLGWDEETRKMNLSWVVNNSRFLILPWNVCPNLASRVLAANLRRLSRDWEAVYGHGVLLAETFVDTSRFRGTCYRASNWVCVGETKGWSRDGKTYRYNGQPKSVWLYPLAKDFKERLCATPRSLKRKDGLMDIDLERLPLYGQGGLFEILESFPDARKRRGIRHKISSVLATAICAVVAGARSFVAMGEWAKEQSAETLKRLGSKRGKPPSERTYRRVFADIDIEEIDRLTGNWVLKQQALLCGDGLALDGKTVRGSRDGDLGARHLLSAIVHGRGTVVAQTAVESKTNEITRVEPLLADLAMEGVVVTADALLTQREIARHIVEDKHADYVFTVKDNQPTLRKDIEDLFASEEEDAKRLHRAHKKPPDKEAFPPGAPDLR